jgi:hypothetical protein
MIIFSFQGQNMAKIIPKRVIDSLMLLSIMSVEGVPRNWMILPAQKSGLKPPEIKSDLKNDKSVLRRA